MTGCLFDANCFAEHNNSGHPENAGRLALVQAAGNVKQIPLRPATDEELQTVHTTDHLRRIHAECEKGGGMLDEDTYCCPQSESVARNAAGGLIDLSMKVLDGSIANGFGITRPPGHHATADQTMGFCLFNSVAVAAAALRLNGVARVAVVDFDVHHGNGTQDIFYEDGTVLYLSSHQYPHFPGTGLAEETGRGNGVGFTLNHPLKAGSGDTEFLAAYENNLIPALTRFAPEFILVSAGYDAHQQDPLAGLNVTTACFGKLSELLVQAAGDLCNGKIVFTLEGGYNPQALVGCIDATMQVLTN